ncbi:MAG: HPr family phosphocarrier protein [Halorhabdus sp.]
MADELSRVVTIVPAAGLHARPASRVVQQAGEFESEIQIGRADSDETVSAKSMLSVSGLAAEQGEAVRLVADGPDAEQALDALEAILTTPEDGEDDE